MRPSLLLVAALVSGLAGGPTTAHAQDTAPATSPAPVAAAPAPKKDDVVGKLRKYFLSRPKDQPSRAERLVVATGAAVVSVVGLGVGLSFGAWALSDYLCLRDVAACADRPFLSQKVEGTDFLKARGEGERKALFSDMGYLVAITFAAVAGLGLAAAFWPAGWWPFAGEEVLEPAAPEPAPAAAEPTPTTSPTTTPAASSTPAASTTGSPQ